MHDAATCNPMEFVLAPTNAQALLLRSMFDGPTFIQRLLALVLKHDRRLPGYGGARR